MEELIGTILPIVIIASITYGIMPKGDKLDKLTELGKTCLVVFNIKTQQKPDDFRIFKEEASYEKGFSQYYQDNLKPLANSYEHKRVHALNKAKLLAIITLPLAGLLGVFLTYFIVAHNIAAFFDAQDGISNLLISFFGDSLIGKIILILSLLGVIFVFASWIVSTPLDAYQTDIKTDIFPKILAFLGTFRYRENGPDYPLYRFSDFDIFPQFDHALCEDYIQGEYNNLALELFECELQKRQSSDKANSYRTVFKGIIINVSVNKPFHSKTLVRRDYGKVFNWLGAKFTKLKRVNLEDPEFEKMFEVYGEDQVEARYLLTTAFMQRLKELVANFNSDSLQCAFYKQKLLIMIPISQNLFEPGSVLEPKDFVNDAKSLLKDMQQMFSIIETLKLDQDIGL